MNKKKYKAMGFVEALIAIMVTGVASVVLMDIAARTMKSTIQNETVDQMTQYAVETAEIVKEIAKNDGGEYDVFPDYLEENTCYAIHKLSNEGREIYSLSSELDSGSFGALPKDERDLYKQAGEIEGTEFFRVVCSPDTGNIETSRFLLVEIIVGKINTEGKVTSGKDTKDYKYLTVVERQQ